MCCMREPARQRTKSRSFSSPGVSAQALMEVLSRRTLTNLTFAIPKARLKSHVGARNNDDHPRLQCPKNSCAVSCG